MAIKRQPVANPDDTGTYLVPLTKGHFAIVDAVDVEAVSRHTWLAKDCPATSRTVYAMTTVPPKRFIKLHAFVAARAGIADGEQIDHRDGNGLNNRRSNLRAATRSENLMNRPRQRNNTSNFKGVSWHKATGKWRASIKVDGVQRSLGYFADPKSAHESYIRAATELHGEFARFD